jgi:8-oxo-dGTP diphosphatase
VFLCHDENGEFAMAKRSEAARDEPGRWDIGGGAIEFGQTVEHALQAEIRQEYCCVYRQATFLGYRDVLRRMNGELSHWVALDFLVEVDRMAVSNGEPHKLDEIRWVSISELPTPLHSGGPSFLRSHSSHLGDFGIGF